MRSSRDPAVDRVDAEDELVTGAGVAEAADGEVPDPDAGLRVTRPIVAGRGVRARAAWLDGAGTVAARAGIG